MARERFTSPPSSDQTHRKIVDVTGLADDVSVNVSLARRLVWERRNPYFKIGKLVRFGLAEVHDWLDLSRVDALR